MGPKQVLPLWVRMDLGVMTMKEYSTFSKAPGLQPLHLIFFSVISRTLVVGRGSNPFTEMLSVLVS